MDQEKRCF